MDKGFDPCRECEHRFALCAGCRYLAVRVESEMRKSAGRGAVSAVASGRACEVCQSKSKPVCCIMTGRQLCNSFSWSREPQTIEPIDTVELCNGTFTGKSALDIVIKINELIEAANRGR